MAEIAQVNKEVSEAQEVARKATEGQEAAQEAQDENERQWAEFEAQMDAGEAGGDDDEDGPATDGEEVAA